MAALAKATLQAIDGSADGIRSPGEQPVRVQFNPASLQLVARQSDRPRAYPGAPERAAPRHGQSHADARPALRHRRRGHHRGPGQRAHQDRARWRASCCPGQGSKQPPPRVRFSWGEFVLDGVMGSYSEDLDLFSASGVPLRAKVSINIQEQDPDYEANRSGPGRGDGGRRHRARPAAVARPGTCRRGRGARPHRRRAGRRERARTSRHARGSIRRRGAAFPPAWTRRSRFRRRLEIDFSAHFRSRRGSVCRSASRPASACRPQPPWAWPATRRLAARAGRRARCVGGAFALAAAGGGRRRAASRSRIATIAAAATAAAQASAPAAPPVPPATTRRRPAAAAAERRRAARRGAPVGARAGAAARRCARDQLRLRRPACARGWAARPTNAPASSGPALVVIAARDRRARPHAPRSCAPAPAPCGCGGGRR